MSIKSECSGCHQAIKDRYLLEALGQLWHEDCLKCSACSCRLGEVGQKLFTKGNMILCKRDYYRIFGTPGICSACNRQIPAYDYVMKAKDNVYHVDCFACQQCNHRFCVGDKFFLLENRIVCENDLPGGPKGPPTPSQFNQRMKAGMTNTNGGMMMTMAMNPNSMNMNSHLNNNNVMMHPNVSSNNIMTGPPNRFRNSK